MIFFLKMSKITAKMYLQYHNIRQRGNINLPTQLKIAMQTYISLRGAFVTNRYSVLISDHQGSNFKSYVIMAVLFKIWKWGPRCSS